MTIQPKTKIGRYQIISLIGRGGMAEVYQARHVDLNIDVAIKFIRTDQFPPSILRSVVKRFQNEGRSMAQLSHPNIVKVTDYGVHKGIPFLVMEYLPGGTLKKYLGKPMPYQQAARLLLPVADALAYAHSKGVIHRDVKPTNILLSETSQPMLSDFGVAKIMDSEHTHGLTATGASIGTPEYMAPEQALGKKIDHRVDIYSLGVILYELVTGRRPFIADTPMEVVIKQTTEPLPAPSRFAKGLPAQAEQVIKKALAKDPGGRFTDMGAFTGALEKLTAGTKSTMRKSTARTRQKSRAVPREKKTQAQPARRTAKKKPINNKWLIGSVSILGVGLMIFIGIRLFSEDKFKAQITDTHEENRASITQVIPEQIEQEISEKESLSPFQDLSPVTVSNISKIELLDQMGLGTYSDSMYSPDGNSLVVGTSLGIYKYGGEDLGLLDFIATDIPVSDLDISDKGNLLAVGMSNGSILIIDFHTFDIINEYNLIEHPIKNISISPTEDSFVINYEGELYTFYGKESGIIFLRLQENSEPIQIEEFQRTNELIQKMEYLKNKNQIILLTQESFKVWDIDEKRFVLIKNMEKGANWLGWSWIDFSIDPEENYIYTIQDYKFLEKWSLYDGQLLGITDLHNNLGYYALLSTDASIVSNCSNGLLEVFNIIKNDYEVSITGNIPCDQILSINQPSQGQVSILIGSELQIIDISKEEIIRQQRISSNPNVTFDFDQSNDYITHNINSRYELETWDLQNQVQKNVITSKREVEIIHGQNNALILGVEEKDTWGAFRLASADITTDNQLHEVESIDIYRLLACKDDVNFCALGLEEEYLFQRPALKIMALEEKRIIQTLPETNIKGLDLSPSGNQIALNTYWWEKTQVGGRIRVWQREDASDFKLVLTLDVFDHEEEQVHDIAFSHNGLFIAVGRENGQIHIYDSVNGVELFKMQVPENPIQQLAFSTTNDILVSGHSDGSIVFWDFRNEELLETLQEHREAINTIDFSPQGNFIVSASQDGTLKYWGLPES